MTLHLHHATRTDALADALAALLAEPLDDPFAEEVVVVPAKGVERWLAQRLSHRLGAGPRGEDGVCAGVRFLNPRSLVAMLTGTERDDPWDPDRYVWPLLDVVDDALDEPWCRTLARHLGHGVEGEQGELRRERRYSVVRRIAGLFAAYAVQRPGVLTDWREGRDTDGCGVVLPTDLAWQPELWRRLVAQVDAPPPDVRHATVLEEVRGGRPLALPDRLSMFGHTRMPRTELELLRAVGEVREVHLWLPQPSPAAWSRLEGALADGPVRRAADGSGRLVHHPLLSSLGRDARELQRSLAVLGPVESHVVPASAPPRTTLLGLLQQDLRDDTVPTAASTASRTLDPADRSVQVHACHGAMRQVEVLRELLVGLMEDDPTLEPRDVLVMCPDVEAYAPLFSAAFGLGDGATDAHPAHGLRVRLADRGLMSTNPLLAMAATLVTIAGGRATASEVLDLAAAEPVRHRFAWGDDDLATITTWVESAGVRWGLTSELRAPYKLQRLGQNTWQAGLDRILLGAAMAEEEGCTLGPCLPLDDVGSSAVDLAGRLAEMVDRLERVVVALRGARTLEEWVTLLREGVLDLGSTAPRDAWQVTQFERELDGVLEAGRTAGSGGTELRLPDVRTLLELRLEPRPTRANFRTGNLTVSTLVPMRSVPHRVVCLVGLDDGLFPRSTVTDGDDVLARDPMTGERDPRSEDRQLLLDAVLATGETLVVTYTGANEHSGQERPPAVPLGELLDALERTVPGAREQALVRHPLQPFDPRNFTGDRPFSFDRAALAGARAAAGPRAEAVPIAGEPLPAATAPDVTLEALQAFLAHPVRGFLRQRLDVAVPAEHEQVDDALPVELDALTKWQVGDRVLRQAISGLDPQHVFLAEQYRGDLPPLQLGTRLLEEIAQRVNGLYLASAPDRSLEPRSVDVTVDLGGGRRLTGVVPDVRGNRIVRVHYSSLSAKHRLASWVDLLALSAGLPDQVWTAATYGYHKAQGWRRSLLGPVDHSALDLLRALVDVHDRGLREPLPLPLKTGHAWADAVRAHKNPLWSAKREWEPGDNSPVPGEQEDAAHVRVHGRAAPFSRLLEDARPDEQWVAGERNRLGQYSRRIWDPVFDHEQVSS
ncbi:exodeoxyribonuclease V subunit gamma [Nocardioides caldifontis]|uniref:exodeoxyribonuclease V subunit gamma n=1 Tax=Nocardioides caldifontis TaxID=2588938 RepID=UPI0011DF8F56|nr:exodeoxyribonuclease V subunit gamma [Nocardioides caldifontis]